MVRGSTGKQVAGSHQNSKICPTTMAPDLSAVFKLAMNPAGVFEQSIKAKKEPMTEIALLHILALKPKTGSCILYHLHRLTRPQRLSRLW